MPAITKPAMTGYTFQGYYDGKAGTGTQYYTAAGASARTWNKDVATATLYAHWTANKYTVTLNSNLYKGDTSTLATNAGTTSVTATYDAAMPAITAPTMTGYTFGGYFATKGGTGTKYYNANGSSARTWNGTADTTLYALWTVNTYTITYKNQGGAALTADNAASLPTSFRYDTGVTLVAATRNGYTFGGWFTASDCTGTAVTSIAADSTASNVTFHAKWTVNTYTITFSNNDSTGSTKATNTTASKTYTVEDAIELPANSRTGYTFGGWKPSTSAGGWGTANLTGTVAKGKTGNVTLTAQWTANTYSVTVNTNGGSAAPTVATQTFDGSAFSVAAPTKTGYSFTGWKLGGTNPDYSTAKYGSTSSPATAIASTTYCKNGETGTVYFKNLSGTAGGKVTLTAQWSARNYKVTYVLSGGTLAGTPSPANGGTYTYDSTLTIAYATRTGYTFTGWTPSKTADSAYTEYNWGTDKFGNTTAVTSVAAGKLGDVTLTANWTANTFSIAYNANAGSDTVTGMPTTKTGQAYDSAYTIPSNTPARTGWKFMGWNTKAT